MSFLILQADARAIPMKDKSIDAMLTDPPYGLQFMGKEWDRGVPGVPFWLEARRVLKPGGYLLAFGGTRTYHRLTCAIEDAGFEIRDCMMWLYGSGFPKSLDVSKAIDKAAGAEREIVSAGKAIKRMIPGADQNKTGSWIKDNGREFIPTETQAFTDAAKEWQGWGTALKPAWEPIIVARKPLDGTVAENVQRWGTGALNIDAGRIGTSDRWAASGVQSPRSVSLHGGVDGALNVSLSATHPFGRWPANLILDEEAAALLDEQSGELTSGNNPAKRSPDKHRNVYAGWKGEQVLVRRATDSGGASRFFYTAKADKKDRGEGNDHPTVKPQAIIEYLLKLVSRPGALILDPFVGSGTTVLVADKMGRRAIGLDNDPKSPGKAQKRCFDDAPLLTF